MPALLKDAFSPVARLEGVAAVLYVIHERAAPDRQFAVHPCEHRLDVARIVLDAELHALPALLRLPLPLSYLLY
ncbi:hypothetical protein AUQ37_03065 [Candidatus Methanomethylophilus sp. 1R26]|nr:hypothetical protein AUQ37_03065 [Candidatus Methanomethylophilus sp. 1R26]